MEINTNAPIVLRHEIPVFAPPERVWERLAQVEFWPSWHPDINDAAWTDDNPMNNRGFTYAVKLFRFNARFQTYDEPRVIAWKAQHLFSIHRQVFRVQGDYRHSVLQSEASYEGRVTNFMIAKFNNPLDRFGQTWLAAIKTSIESARENSVRLPGTRRPPSIR